MAYSVQELCSAGVGYAENDVITRFDECFSRKKHPDYESLIDTTWEDKKKQGCYLFDKSKFRFYRAIVSNQKSLILNVGLTSYKEFIGTNCAPYGEKLLDLGMCQVSEDNDESGHIYLANPLGVASMIETKDSKFVFLRRSACCAESPGQICAPGGHPEPEEIVSSLQDLSQIDGSKITREIFSSVVCEILDEVNIPKIMLEPPVLLGISFNKETCNRPAMEFYVRCNMTSDEVKKKYDEQTQSEKFETTEILFTTRDTLQNIIESKNDKLWLEMANSTKAALHLLAIYLSWTNK